MSDLLTVKGWQCFAATPESLAWAQAANAAADRVLADPGMQQQWLQCEGTWFVGVDALPSAVDGSVAGVPLEGRFRAVLEPLPPLHRAQLSVTFPGYPRPRKGEGAAAFGYRLKRDAAHVDGIIAGPDRRRRIAEPHAFILGLPLTEPDPEASPLVVWEGSHRIIGDALRAALQPHPETDWPHIDITDAYNAARRLCFETCARVPLVAAPGEALLLDRRVLHGVAPWGPQARTAARRIAYFRPLFQGPLDAWLGSEPFPAPNLRDS